MYISRGVRNAHIPNSESTTKGIAVGRIGRMVWNFFKLEAKAEVPSPAAQLFKENHALAVYTLSVMTAADYVSVCVLLIGTEHIAAVFAGSQFPTEGTRICTQSTSNSIHSMSPSYSTQNRQRAILVGGSGSRYTHTEFSSPQASRRWI